MSCWLQLLLQLTFMASGFGTSVVARAVERSLMLPSEEMDRFIAPGSSEMGSARTGKNAVIPLHQRAAPPWLRNANSLHRCRISFTDLHSIPPEALRAQSPRAILRYLAHCTALPLLHPPELMVIGYNLVFFLSSLPTKAARLFNSGYSPSRGGRRWKAIARRLNFFAARRRKTLQRLAFHSHRSYGSPVFAKRGEGKSKQHIAP